MLQLAADIGAAAARKHILAAEVGVAKKLEAQGVRFTYPDKKPFIQAATQVHAAFAGERGPEYVKLIEAITAEAN